MFVKMRKTKGIKSKLNMRTHTCIPSSIKFVCIIAILSFTLLNAQEDNLDQALDGIDEEQLIDLAEKALVGNDSFAIEFECDGECEGNNNILFCLLIWLENFQFCSLKINLTYIFMQVIITWFQT